MKIFGVQPIYELHENFRYSAYIIIFQEILDAQPIYDFLGKIPKKCIFELKSSNKSKNCPNNFLDSSHFL